MAIPFRKAQELNSQLRMNSSNKVVTLERSDTLASHSLPGYPLQPLQPSSGQSLLTFLRNDLETTKLNQLAPFLWLVATPSSSSISALHHQLVRGRHITLTENPDLHLVWIRDRVFLKPIPPYLLSHSFWSFYFEHQSTIPSSEELDLLHKSSLGFLRSYFHLIKHECDFRLAIEHHLIPSTATFEEYCHFIQNFAEIDDGSVTPRFLYGELRLTRLNTWSKIFLGRFNFEEVAGQYETYFARFYGPLLFVFGVFSVFLSAMQVGLATESQPDPGSAWAHFVAVSRWSAVVVLIVVAIVIAGLLSLLLYMVFSELIYALRHRHCRSLMDRH